MSQRPRRCVLRRHIGTLTPLMLAVLAGPGRTAAADGPSANSEAPTPTVDHEARLLYEEGLKRYKLGAYDEAIEKLTASYARVPAPGLLYDLAQAHRRKGDCAGALALYRQYLALPTPDAVRSLAEARAAELEACAKTQAARPVFPTGAPASSAASPRPIGRLAQSIVNATPQSASSIVTGGLGKADGGSPHIHRRRAVWASAIATGVLAATTGAFAWRSAEMSDRVSSTFVPGSTWNGAAMDAQRSGQTSETLTFVAGAATLVAGGITTWLLVTDR